MLNSITSKINPNILIEYDTPQIDIQDYKSVSDRYKLTIKDSTVIDIALGKPVFKRNKPSILYYNIYYINGDQHTKIGIFEIEYNEENRIALYKNFEKIDISIFDDPIFFKDKLKETFPELYLSTMTPIEEIDTEIDTFERDIKTAEENTGKMEDYTEEIETTIDDDDDVITLDSVSEKVSINDDDDDEQSEQDEEDEEDYEEEGEQSEQEDEEEEQSEQEDEEDNVEEELLEEETLNDHKIIQEQYMKQSDHNWIQKTMKNPNYKIEDNGSEDSSLFNAVLKALNNEQIELNDMRQIISDSLSETEYKKYKELVKELKETQGVLKEKLHLLSKKDITGMDRLVKSEESKTKQNEITRLKKDVDYKERLLLKYSFVDKINSLEELKQIALTEEYWGDNIALALLESLLEDDKIKIIVLLEEKQRENDLNKIVNCNNYNKLDVNDQLGKHPTYYVILSLYETRYRLVTYKDKYTLRFSELPYGIKRRLIDNCTNVV